MVNCPQCDAAIDVEEDDVDEGDVITCDECGADLRVIGTKPVELEGTDDLDGEEEDEEGLFEDDEDTDVAEEEEEEDWK